MFQTVMYGVAVALILLLAYLLVPERHPEQSRWERVERSLATGK